MRKSKKEAISRLVFILLILFAIISFVFMGIRFSGFAVTQTLGTTSGVIIDPGMQVIFSLFSGETTNFFNLSDSELANITNMTLEKTFGKIVFSENIDLTDNAVNNLIDLDSNVDIYFRGLSINLLSLSSLNKPSIVTLNAVGLSSPYLYIDDEPCNETCDIISYSNNILIANISSGFSKLEVFEHPFCGDSVCQDFNSESCYNCPGDCGYCELPSGYNTGTGTSTSTSSTGTSTSTGSQVLGTLTQTVPEGFFSIKPGLLKVNFIQGESKRESFNITNEGKNKIDLILSSELDGELIIISEPNISLKKNQTKEVIVDFFSKVDKQPDVYISKINIEGGGKYRNLILIIELIAKNPLFDIITRLNKKSVYVSENLKVMIDIKNMGELENIDVELYYGIKNFDNDILYFRQESIAIEKKLSVTREIEVPEYIPEGDYIFYTRVSYNNITAASMEQLKILSPEKPLIIWDMQTILILIVVILLIIIIYFYIKRKFRRI